MSTPLRTDGIDNGLNIVLKDIEGRPVWKKDSKATEWNFDYEASGLGRPLAVSEQIAGGSAQIKDRLVYDDGTTTGYNLCNQLVRHYDTGGVQELVSLSIAGQVLEEAS